MNLMNIDLKHDLLKNFLGTLSPSGKKNLNTTIDQSMITAAYQKSLSMDLRNENEKSEKKFNKNKKRANLGCEQNLGFDLTKTTPVIIVRDPISLLKLF